MWQNLKIDENARWGGGNTLQFKTKQNSQLLVRWQMHELDSNFFSKKKKY